MQLTTMLFKDLPNEIIFDIAARIGYAESSLIEKSGLFPEIYEILDDSPRVFDKLSKHYKQLYKKSDKKPELYDKIPKIHIYENEKMKKFKVILFSKGKNTLMVKWNLDNTFEVGQWLCNKHIFYSICGLSDTGLFSYDYHVQGRECFSVICSPPYFTAHVFMSGSFSRIGHYGLFKEKSKYECLRNMDKLYNIDKILLYDFKKEQFKNRKPSDYEMLGKVEKSEFCSYETTKYPNIVKF